MFNRQTLNTNLFLLIRTNHLALDNKQHFQYTVGDEQNFKLLALMEYSVMFSLEVEGNIEIRGKTKLIRRAL